MAPKPARRKVNLEQVFTPKPQDTHGVPLCILDFRVAVHSILSLTDKFALATRIVVPLVKDDRGVPHPNLDVCVDHPLWENWVRANWAVRLNRGPDMLPLVPYRVVVVDDNKQELKCGRSIYWRSLVYDGYKGDRSAESTRDRCYKSIRDIGHKMVADLCFPFYTEELFEADDWAGLCHRLKKAAPVDSLLCTREMYYSTVDSDWLQLVDDASSQLWANTGPWPSRLKNEAETRAYVLKRMKVRISSPWEIAGVKQLQGDDADSLPAGSPLELFDLCSSHPVYTLATGNLLDDLSNPEANTSYKNLERATTWISRQVYRADISP